MAQSNDNESTDNKYNLQEVQAEITKRVDTDYERVKNVIASLKQAREHERKMDALRESMNNDDD